MLTYSESAEGMIISHARALAELASHGVDVSLDDDGAMTVQVAEFYRDVDPIGSDADGDTYLASDVLEWLGY